ncbi:MAG TPA: VCBS repeat-containing protein [Pirellulaceae bacterium]|nr:VCBS repeat-containing protein [Pirellulaceae bacterium]
MHARVIYSLVGVVAVASCVTVSLLYRGRSPDASDAVREQKVNVAVESSLFLPDDEREFLWQCEHFGNLLGEYGWRTVGKATQQQQADVLVNALAADFRGKVTEPRAESRFEDGVIAIQRSVGAAHEVGREEFVKWLLSLRNAFDSDLAIQFATLSLTPASRSDLAGDWNGRCRLRISGKHEQQPQELFVSFTFTISNPTQENLEAGGWWSNCEVTQIDSAQSQNFLMRQVAAERGVLLSTLHDNWTAATGPPVVATGGIYLCDFNRDGYTDVLVTEPFSIRSTFLYRGLPEGRFEDATYELRLPNVPGADHALFADIDNDGWEDLIFLGRAVFRNDSGIRFQDATRASNLTQLVIAGGIEGVSATVADYDRDGLIDIYITRADVSRFNQGSWIDGKSGTAANNQLLRNLGNGKFEDVTKAAGAAGGQRSAFTANWLDANDDGWPDVYVIHEFGTGALLVNQQDGTFSEQQIAEQSDDFGSMGLASGDVDNDGQIDLYVSNMYSKAGNRVMDNLSSKYYDATTMDKLRRMVAGSQLHINRGEGKFAPTENRDDIAAVGWAWGASLVDLNNDGWLDIHAACGFMSKERTKPDG